MSGARRRLVAGLLGLSVVLGGCGVGGEGASHEVADGAVPFGLLEATTPSDQTVGAGAVPVEVYLVDEGRVVPVGRRLPTASDLRRLVRLVAVGPSEAERDRGLTTALPEPSAISAVRLSGGIATVELRASFAELPTEEQRTALAQVVFTLTARPGIGRVAFTVADTPVEVPQGDGTLTDESVSRDAYAELVAPAE